jgi:hypothetical protein
MSYMASTSADVAHQEFYHLAIEKCSHTYISSRKTLLPRYEQPLCALQQTRPQSHPPSCMASTAAHASHQEIHSRACPQSHPLGYMASPAAHVSHQEICQLSQQQPTHNAFQVLCPGETGFSPRKLGCARHLSPSSRSVAIPRLSSNREKCPARCPGCCSQVEVSLQTPCMVAILLPPDPSQHFPRSHPLRPT